MLYNRFIDKRKLLDVKNMQKNYNTSLCHVFSIVSIQRSALMGLAMFTVFMCHAPSEKLGFTPTGIVGLICQYGSWGVDVFLYLSAIGLCYSLQKNDLKVFYRNRVVRILPTWLIVLIGIHLLGLVIGPIFPEMDFTYPKNFVECLSWYTGLGFYFNTCHYEWYVPALLLLYCISPLLYRSSKKILFLLILSSLFFNIINNKFLLFPHLNYMVERLPVFCLGFLFFKEFQDKTMVRFLKEECFIFTLVYILWEMNFVSKTIVFGSTIPVVLVVIGLLLNKMHIIPLFFTFLGGISLEFYLVHLYRRPQFLISLWIDDVNIQVLLAFILCLFISYLLHSWVRFLLNRFS